MSNPAALAAVPGLIRATRLSVEENAPFHLACSIQRAWVILFLHAAEDAAERLVEAVPEATEAARRPPQQVHAPIADQVEPPGRPLP